MKKSLFQLAKKLSKKSDHHTHHIGCVIAKRNKIVGIGWNKLKTHPNSPHPYNSLHAELDAIIRENIDMANLEVYTYREHRDGRLANARPCKTCQAALKSIGVTKMNYTFDGEYRSEAL